MTCAIEIRERSSGSLVTAGFGAMRVQIFLDRERSNTSFLGPESANPISSSVGRLKIKEWQAKKHSEYWAAEVLHCTAFGKTLYKDLQVSDRKQRRLITR